jgi:hypothetical protein
MRILNDITCTSGSWATDRGEEIEEGLGREYPHISIRENLDAYKVWKFSVSIRHPNNNNDSVTLVRERTKPIERPPLFGEVGANFCS